MEQIQSINFTVTYRLGEYLALVNEHVLATASPENADKLQSLFYRSLLAVVGSVMFAYKSFRVGTCSFTIDQSTVTRRSRGGELVVPWSEVTAVHEYKLGYLIAKKSGAMPIPYRALSKHQLDTLAAWVAPYRHPRDAT